MLRNLFSLGRPLRRLAEVSTALALGLLISSSTAIAQDDPVIAPLVLKNLVLDGDFTSGGAATTSNLIAAPGKFGAWTVDLGNVGLHVNEFATPGGIGNVVDLNGTRSGSIFQSIDTLSSGQYTVSVLVSGNWTTNPNSPRSVSLRFGAQKVSWTVTRPAGWSKSNPQWQVFSADFLGTGLKTALRLSSENAGIPDGALITAVEIRGPIDIPGPLSTVPVPTPPNLADFVQDREKAVALGKAFFWDMQVGGDGRTACASCHWHAGADVRTGNVLNPGAPGSAFGAQRAESVTLGADAVTRFRGPAKGLKPSDFPFHRVANPLLPKNTETNPVVSDTLEIAGSEGVVSQLFAGITEGSEIDKGEKRSNPIFEVSETSIRQTTGRNSPTPINAVFLDRSFWDGRASRYFNGVNEFGDLDPDARVLRAAPNGTLQPVRILLDNATLASQAVGPVNSHVEMSWLGRPFRDVGRKVLSLRPLALQHVAADDSVLAAYRDHSGKGLDAATAGYASLIRAAFHPEWWSGTQITPDGYTQMEANFSLFWGLSVMLYEATLISDQTPFDAFAQGNEEALSPEARVGLSIFMNEGRCIDCHAGSEFAGATVSHLRPINPGREGSAIEFMPSPKGPSFYDKGFYNIGVRQTFEDLGVGAAHPKFGPLSYTRQEQSGRNRDSKFNITPQARVTVDGAFKSPSLRNIELTGPYMHNGGMKSLEEVMEFYARGADFFHENIQDMAPGVHGIPSLQNNPEGIAAVVEFMKHLTDERVRIQAAPFDHPELLLPDGPSAITPLAALDRMIVFPATGRNGGTPISDFETILRDGLGYDAPPQEEPTEEESTTGGDLPEEPADEEPAAEEEMSEEEADQEEQTPVEEEEMTEEPLDEEAAEEEVTEEPAVEEQEEGDAGDEGDRSNREPISLPTPDADDVPENKKHLIDRNVKPPREEAPEQGGDEEAHEEESAEEGLDEEEAAEEEAGVEEDAAEEGAEEEEAVEEEEMTEEPLDEEVTEEEAVEEPAVEKQEADGDEDAHEEEAAEEGLEDEEAAEEEAGVEDDAAEDEAEEEEAGAEEEMTEGPADEEVAEEEVAEEPAVEEQEEGDAGDEGDHSNREPISLPTPDADDVPENKKHLIDRNVKPLREEAPEEGGDEEAHEEEPAEEGLEEEEAAEEGAEDEEVGIEEDAAEEGAEEEEAPEEEEMTEEPAEEGADEEDEGHAEEGMDEEDAEENAEEDADYGDEEENDDQGHDEEEMDEEPVAEEPEESHDAEEGDEGDEGDYSNREPISLPTPDADDVPENKKHLIDRNVKLPQEEAPEEGDHEEAHEEEMGEEGEEEEMTEEPAEEEADEEDEGHAEEDMEEEDAEEDAGEDADYGDEEYNDEQGHDEEEMDEEPVAEEPEEGHDAEEGDEGDYSNREPISLPTPDADDVPENKKHLIDRNVKPPQEEAPEEGDHEDAYEEETGEEGEEEEMTEQPAEEEADEEDEGHAEEDMEEEDAEEDAGEDADYGDEEYNDEQGHDEEEMDEEPVAEEPEEEGHDVEEGDEGDYSNREPISLPTPDADDVPENKKHLIDRNVKPPQEEAPEEGDHEDAYEEETGEEGEEEEMTEQPAEEGADEEDEGHAEEGMDEEDAEENAEEDADYGDEEENDDQGHDEEELDEEAVAGSKQHLLNRKAKPARESVSGLAQPSDLPDSNRVMEGVDPTGIDVPPGVDENPEIEEAFEEGFVTDIENEISKPEVIVKPQIALPDVWICVLPTPFSIGVFGFPVDEDGKPIMREVESIAEPGFADEELVTVTDVPPVDPKGILVGRTVKPAQASVEPTQPSPKGFLLQRKPKSAGAAAE